LADFSAPVAVRIRRLSPPFVVPTMRASRGYPRGAAATFVAKLSTGFVSTLAMRR
jgi:hypothetical protein